MVEYEWALRGHLRVKAAGGQLPRGPLNMTGDPQKQVQGIRKLKVSRKEKAKLEK